MRTIASRHNPAVRAFRDLAEHPDPSGARLLLDGAHLIRDALDAGLEFEIACVALEQEPTTESARLAAVLDHRGVDVVSLPSQLFALVSPVRTPSGIAAIARRPRREAPDIWSGPSPLVAVAVDVQDPGNVGAIIRVADAIGVAGVVVTGASANPFSWKALRGSMGSALRLPVVTSSDVSDVQSQLRESRIRTVGAVARDGVDPEAVDWHGGVAILVGGEGSGLSDSVVARCDARVTIPMASRVESVNVAVAAAILLYTARRHRQAGA